MIKAAKKIVLVSASPKVDQDWAVSAFLANYITEKLQASELTVETVKVRHALMHHLTDFAFETLQSADAIVFIFPLYFFCLPAMLTRFLQDFVKKHPAADKPCQVYALVNCGFPEPDINMEAMRVIECFSVQTERTFFGGLMFGGGGMLIGTADAPFMRPVFEKIDQLSARVLNDTVSGSTGGVQIDETSPRFPRPLYYFGGNFGWNSMARKNGVRIREIKRKPYQK